MYRNPPRKRCCIPIIVGIALLLLPTACTDKDRGGATAEEYFQKSYHFIDGGYIEDAIRLLTLAIEKDPKFLKAYYNRGVIYYTRSDYERAFRDFDKVVELDPGNAAGYAGRGTVQEGLGREKEAMADYQAAARLGHRETQDYLKSKGIDW